MDIDLHSPKKVDPRSLGRVVKAALETKVPDDGMVFDTNSIRVAEIRTQQRYQGLRVRFTDNYSTHKHVKVKRARAKLNKLQSD